jgi:hypothetical protein
MNEQDDSHHTGNSQGDGGGQSLIPATPEHAGSEDRSAEKMAKDASEGASKEPSKSITLQRMPPQSSWEDIVFGDAPAQPQAQRRFPSMILMIGLAALVGAMSGAGTTWLSTEHFGKNDKAQVATVERNRAIDNAFAQVNSELQSLKMTAENAAKANAGKIAKFSDALEKMKAADATGSIPAPAAAPVPAKPAPQIARLPTVEGWVVRAVANGGALVEGRAGIFEVYAGDPLPGVGRVDAIRRQDGRWVVVTSRGLIVAR